MSKHNSTTHKRMPEDENMAMPPGSYTTSDYQMAFSAGASPAATQPITPTADEDTLEFTLKAPRVPTPRVIPRSRRWQFIWEKRVSTVAMLAFDGVMLNIGFLLAFYVRFNLLTGKAFLSQGVPFVPTTLAIVRPFQVGFIAGMLILMALRGMYRLRLTGSIWRQLGILLNAAFTGFALYSVYEYVIRASPVHSLHLGLDDNTRAFVAFAWLSAIVAPFIGRLLLSLIISLGYRAGIARRRVLVIGSGNAGRIVMQHLAALPALGYHVIGFISERHPQPPDFGRFRVLGQLDNLEFVLRQQRISEAVIALPSSNQGEITRSVRICERNGITFKLVPDLQEFSLSQFELEDVGGLPLFDVRRRAGGIWQRQIKRAVDIVGAGIILVVGAPLWLLLTVLIRLDSPGPTIYRQTRVGYYGRPFTTLKFRSMYIDADAHKAELLAANQAGRGLFKLKNDPRCTRVGRFIRRTSIDEVPQLINILRGEMSLVGPRPPLPEEFMRYEEWEKRRLEMPPGLTGLWQVRGRSNIVFEEMVLMDLYYIENWNVLLDLRILLKTIPTVLFSHGAY